MSAPKSIPVQKVTYRDKNNVLCHGLYLVVNGQLVKPTKPLGYVWSMRRWVNQSEDWYSKGDFVFEAYGIAYRMGQKSAKPLKLKEGETLEPMDFCVDPITGRQGCVVFPENSQPNNEN